MNTYFRFKQFQVNQESCAMKVSTDSCLFGAWVAGHFLDASHILDIGAGTGLLMLMIAQKNAGIIKGIEIEEACYEQMKNNLSASPWKERLQPVWGDVREFVSESKYDLIISNPPFYEDQLTARDDASNKARHSSHLTLEELVSISSGLVTETGSFAILIPYYRTEEMLAHAERSGLYLSHHACVRHSPTHRWYRSMMIFSKQHTSPLQEEIEVHDAQGGYSEKFRALLKDYYLKL